MATSINVLSWNVESLGTAKAVKAWFPLTQSEVIRFIALVIANVAADIVGIMEIKSDSGSTIRDFLLKELNNTPMASYEWKAALSTRQDGGTMEQALILWKDEPNRLELAPDPLGGCTQLIGVVDENVMDAFFARKAWGFGDRLQFWSALADAGYVAYGRFKDRRSFRTTSQYRVVPDKWGALASQATPAVEFPGLQPPAMTLADRQWVAKTLKAVDILRFTTYAYRSPYIANFLVGPAKLPLAVALFHAPGPQDPTRFEAINIIAQSEVLRNAADTASVLVMGDFNIAASTWPPLGRRWARLQNGASWSFEQVKPVTLVRVFAPLETELGGTDQIGANKTTLINGYVAATAGPDDALGQTYDKFFFGSKTKTMTASAPAVENLLDRLATNQMGYVSDLARSVMAFYLAFRGPAFLLTDLADIEEKRKKEQAKLVKAQDALADAMLNGGYATPNTIANLRYLQKLKARDTAQANVDWYVDQLNYAKAVNDALGKNPVEAANVAEALPVYRYAVSDHLPISITVTAP